MNSEVLKRWLFKEGMGRTPYEASIHFAIKIEDVYRVIKQGER